MPSPYACPRFSFSYHQRRSACVGSQEYEALKSSFHDADRVCRSRRNSCLDCGLRHPRWPNPSRTGSQKKRSSALSLGNPAAISLNLAQGISSSLQCDSVRAILRRLQRAEQPDQAQPPHQRPGTGSRCWSLARVWLPVRPTGMLLPSFRFLGIDWLVDFSARGALGACPSPPGALLQRFVNKRRGCEVVIKAVDERFTVCPQLRAGGRGQGSKKLRASCVVVVFWRVAGAVELAIMTAWWKLGKTLLENVMGTPSCVRKNSQTSQA